MSDRYAQIANNPVGRFIAGNVGLPVPPRLDRHQPGKPVLSGTALLGAAPGGRLAGPVARALASAGAQVATELRDDLRSAAASAGLDASVWNPEAPADQRFKALVLDATGIADSTRLRELHAFFHPTIRRLEPNGRIVVLGTQPELSDNPRAATAQRALEGLSRSLGKEARAGATSQLVLVAPGAEDQIESTLRFLLSARSAYVSGQVVRIGPAQERGPSPSLQVDWERPLAGRVALVTGSSRGIGAAIASVLERDGATVVGLDVPGAADNVDLAIDITADDAPTAIAGHLERHHGGVDVVVHNAGVTRDKTLGRMDEDVWSTVIDINLSSEERINDALLEGGLLRENGRIVCVSSISGIAGNAGQTNYATSKAGVIGMVQALASVVAGRPATINAVAPGFIETQMTARMPIAIREAGRRMNSLSQGGLPIDVAEAVAWFASPASAGINGNVVRVCGQSLVGA
jgi:3-oxoacyl-[acyl-carrier protein] reductase